MYRKKTLKILTKVKRTKKIGGVKIMPILQVEKEPLIHSSSMADMRKIAQKIMRKKHLTEKEARKSLGLKKYE